MHAPYNQVHNSTHEISDRSSHCMDIETNSQFAIRSAEARGVVSSRLLCDCIVDCEFDISSCLSDLLFRLIGADLEFRREQLNVRIRHHHRSQFTSHTLLLRSLSGSGQIVQHLRQTPRATHTETMRRESATGHRCDRLMTRVDTAAAAVAAAGQMRPREALGIDVHRRSEISIHRAFVRLVAGHYRRMQR
jgi:hypothetical protein